VVVLKIQVYSEGVSVYYFVVDQCLDKGWAWISGKVRKRETN
jgi:hypothetical protein